MSEQAILRALVAGPMTTPQLQMRLSATIAKVHTVQIILNLQKAGKIILRRGGKWQLTERGYAMLPKTMPVREWGVYVPPPRNWRAGSDVALKLPSVFAGKRQEMS